MAIEFFWAGYLILVKNWSVKEIYGLKRHEEFIFINIKVLKNSYLKRFILNIKNVKK